MLEVLKEWDSSQERGRIQAFIYLLLYKEAEQNASEQWLISTHCTVSLVHAVMQET